MENVSDKDKKKFDVSLINSCVVYWYMKNMDGTFEIGDTVVIVKK